ncbi:integrase catalytic subunit [Burkholderia multivorans]|nr:integrase catalytic subunit [Burkholderia multivorans]
MKTVCEVLGVARSAVAVKRARSSDWRDGRRARVTNDAGLVEEIQAHVAHLPTYGYRRVWALLRRSREQSGAPCINVKRVYRVMREHQLLLRRPGVRRDKRRHDGRVAVDRSNTRWCSDGFEFRCDDGTPLRVTFALDCCVDAAMPSGLDSNITGFAKPFALPVPPPAVRPPLAEPATVRCVASVNDFSAA